MCGITGIFHFDNEKPNPELLRSMTSTLYYRGPDDSGYYINNNIALGHRRLSIIDLSKKAKQPMSDSDDNIWITFNGEIYNYIELKNSLQKKGHTFSNQSDTEVIINAYKEYGEQCVSYLRGMFAFAIWDNNKKQLFLARDRLGKKTTSLLQ